MSQTVLINKNDLSDVLVVQDYANKEGALESGHIRVEIGTFALTANNITYLVTGEQIGYWNYFDPKAYNISVPQTNIADYGRMPVWGYGTVRESLCADIGIGTRIYGFFPVATHIDMNPTGINDLGFYDGTVHRQPLHSIYNRYIRVDNDPSFPAHLDELQPVLRPLFTTSFLIDDFLAAEGFFGAEQVVVLSASSKTALGTAFCLKQREGLSVIGLTSAANQKFVEDTEFYDQVLSYQDSAKLDPKKRTVIVDMAGNGEVMGQIYDHLGESLVYNCMVGKSHWQGARPPRPSKGAPAVMFFAPDRAKLRVRDWGGAEFADKLGALWTPFCDSAKHWLTLDTRQGVSAWLETYNAFLNGQADPQKGYLISLNH